MLNPFITHTRAQQLIQEAFDGVSGGYRGPITVSDDKKLDGFYIPMDDSKLKGPYIKAGGLTYDPTDEDKGKFVTFILSNDVWRKHKIEFEVLTLNLINEIKENNKDAVSGSAVIDYAIGLNEFVDIKVGKNLYNGKKIKNHLINTGDGIKGDITPATDWSVSEPIKIKPNTRYTISADSRRHGFSLFENKEDRTNPIYSNTATDAGAPRSFTSLENANYLIISLDTSTIQSSNVQVEEGSVATDYEPYIENKSIKPSKIILDLINEVLESSEKGVQSSAIYNFIKPILDLTNQAPNLFDDSKSLDNYLVSNFGTVDTALDWKASNIIKVEEGEKYTLSGTRGRWGLAFFKDKDATIRVADSVDISKTMPLTVTAPIGANFVVFNLENRSVPNQSGYSNIQFEKGEVATTYYPYGTRFIKKEALPDIDVDDNFIYLDENTNSGTYLKTTLNNKSLLTYIRAFPKNSLPVDIVRSYYDGELIKQSEDNTAPYRLASSTIGANHQAGEDNKDISRKYYIDNVEVLEFNKSYSIKKEFKIVEKYTLYFNNQDIAEVSYSYVFDLYGNIVLYTDILGVADGIALMDIMFVMDTGIFGNYGLLIPKTIPFEFESENYDFSEVHNMNDYNVTGRINVTSSRYLSEGISPNRAIMIRSDINYHIGLLPLQSASLENRVINAGRKALQISNSKKLYFSTIDSASITTINKGDYYSAVAYKGWSVPNGNAVSLYTIPTELGIYVYIDWVGFIGTDKIEMNPLTIGKDFEVVEKSDTVEILNNNNTGSMNFEVSGKAYLALKFI